jgi:hypothetical protein
MLRCVRLVALLAIVCASACKTENPLDFHTPAPPPPRGLSVRIDLSAFRGKSPPAGPSHNFADALGVIAHLDSTIAPHLELAAVALDNAAEHQVAKPNDFWEWPYDVSLGGVRYTGRLLGGRQGTANTFRLAISSSNASPPFTNYTLLNGVIDYLTTQGRWYVYDLKSTSTAPAMSVNWIRQNSIVQLSVERPGEIYGYEINQGFHHLSRIGRTSADALTMLWNPADGTGGVSISNSAMQCWNAQLQDVLC